jgi:hypothetical protein
MLGKLAANIRPIATTAGNCRGNLAIECIIPQRCLADNRSAESGVEVGKTGKFDWD